MNQSGNIGNGAGDINNISEDSRPSINGHNRTSSSKYTPAGRMNGHIKTLSITDILKDYSWEEKFEWMHQKKLKGNRLFSKKKYEAAIQLYQEALLGIDLKCTPEKKQRVIHEIQIPCLLNTASCLKQKKDFMKGLELCNRALELNRDAYLSYIRRGMIYQAMREYEKAMNDYRHAKDCGADEASLGVIEKSVEEIKAAQENPRRTQKEFIEEGSLYQDITVDESIDKITVQESKSNIDDDGPKVLHYNDDLEELNKFGLFKYVAYPIKMSYKFVRDKTMWCRRRRTRTNYEMADTESGQP